VPYASPDERFVIPSEPALVWPRPRIDASQFFLCFDDSFTIWFRASIPEQLSIKPVRRNRSIIDPEFPAAFRAGNLVPLLKVSEACPYAGLIVLLKEPLESSDTRIVTHKKLESANVTTHVWPVLFALPDIQRAQAERTREEFLGRRGH
jgi:hypothetical protein